MSGDLAQRLWTAGCLAEASNVPELYGLLHEAKYAIDALAARVARLEACLNDVKEQLELGGEK